MELNYEAKTGNFCRTSSRLVQYSTPYARNDAGEEEKMENQQALIWHQSTMPTIPILPINEDLASGTLEEVLDNPADASRVTYTNDILRPLRLFHYTGIPSF